MTKDILRNLFNFRFDIIYIDVIIYKNSFNKIFYNNNELNV